MRVEIGNLTLNDLMNICKKNEIKIGEKRDVNCEECPMFGFCSMFDKNPNEWKKSELSILVDPEA